MECFLNSMAGAVRMIRIRRDVKVSRIYPDTESGEIFLTMEYSKYNLSYDPETDRLEGNHFKMIKRQDHEVECIRAK